MRGIVEYVNALVMLAVVQQAQIRALNKQLALSTDALERQTRVIEAFMEMESYEIGRMC